MKWFTKQFKVPLLGSYSVRDVVGWMFMAIVAGLSLFAVVKIPYVGGYVSAGMTKIKSYLPWSQA